MANVPSCSMCGKITFPYGPLDLCAVCDMVGRRPKVIETMGRPYDWQIDGEA